VNFLSSIVWTIRLDWEQNVLMNHNKVDFFLKFLFYVLIDFSLVMVFILFLRIVCYFNQAGFPVRDFNVVKDLFNYVVI
jgi:hypothetical protein